MDERVRQFRVGIFVLLTIIILMFLIYIFSEVWKGKYTVFIKPNTAPGVTRNTPVRKNGILIGRVAAVRTQDDHVVISLRIDDDELIYENEIASIGTDSFLGDAVVEVLPLPADKRGAVIKNGKFVNQVAVKRNPLEIVDVALNLESQIADTLTAVKQAGLTIDDAGKGVNNLTETVNTAFQSEDSDIKLLIAEFRSTGQKAQIAIDNFNTIFENINSFVDDPNTKDRFSEVIGSLPKIFEEVRGAISDARETITSFQKISNSADTNLKNLEDFTSSLKTEGPEILERVNESLSNVDTMFSEIQSAAKSLGKLQNSEGTIGKLLNDTELYDSVTETVNNIREVSQRLEPLMNDLRVFGDSIARDPGQLGVRGALKRRDAEGTGYKGTAARGGLRFGRRLPTRSSGTLR